jgi:hypothetical protein
MKLTRTTVVYVRWFDSAIYTGEACPADELDGYSEMESAGVLLHEDDDKITLAVDRSLETQNVRLVICIPKANVREIQRFRTTSSSSSSSRESSFALRGRRRRSS